MCKKELYVVGAAIVMVVAVVMFIPVMGAAGSLEPSAAPAPTMKTLDQIPPTWFQKLPAAQRFELVLDGAAVLDKETGLVWEKSPRAHMTSWVDAIAICANFQVGGRYGWHLPTIEQLASLLDADIFPPSLSAGHPFTGVGSSIYWSATTDVGFTTNAWYASFAPNGGLGSLYKLTFHSVWCVRGGQGYDAY